MYRVVTTKEVDKFLEKQTATFRGKCLQLFDVLSRDPMDKTLNIKPLSGLKNKYRLRVSKYRFLYEVRRTDVLIYIYKADSRGDVYKA